MTDTEKALTVKKMTSSEKKPLSLLQAAKSCKSNLGSIKILLLTLKGQMLF